MTVAKKRPEWKDSKYADAKGKFKDLSCEGYPRKRNRIIFE